MNARHVGILVGSGTLANDVVAGQIALLQKPGLILTNGEFGERLVDHAARFGLDFEKLAAEWGSAFGQSEIGSCLDRVPAGGWIWAVHCETSTGTILDIDWLGRECSAREIHLCLDCVSTIGTIPLSLERVHLASGVSGKGLASLAGLALVFYNHEVRPAPRTLPRYLDLGYYAAQGGVPFTHSSNLLAALETALARLDSGGRFEHMERLSVWLRGQLRQGGFRIVADGLPVSPAVVTLELPPALRVENVGRRMEELGFLLSYRSEYLRRRNWIQLCLMGECRRRDLVAMLERLTEICGEALRSSRQESPESPRLQAV